MRELTPQDKLDMLQGAYMAHQEAKAQIAEEEAFTEKYLDALGYADNIFVRALLARSLS